MRQDTAAVCTQHLQAIGQALEGYQRDHGELPARLADLHPDYVADQAAFRCPADTSAGNPALPETDAAPPFPISYFYEMSPDTTTFSNSWLGPPRPNDKATWREIKTFERISFGDRVPVVRCFHHDRFRLNLTPSGKVYRDQRGWQDEPETAAVALERLEHDLIADPRGFSTNWSFSAVENYSARWIDSALAPAFRHRLGTVADRITGTASAWPDATRAEAARLSARFYRAAGRMEKVLTAAEEALCLSGDPAGAAFLRADARYRMAQKRVAPPIDAFIRAEMARHHIPGVSLAVLRDGRVIRAEGYGLANVEWSIPATKDTVYAIYSVTKQFTATAVMMLIEAGKLVLEGKVAQYLPNLPEAWSEVTVRHLLTHTSGIKSYTGLPDFLQGARHDVTHDEIIQRVAGFPLEFPPGEKFAYNNTGYYLLGMLIEQASGKPYGDYLSERIFQPLGMTATRVNEPAAVISNRASGYSWRDNTLCNCGYSSPTQPYAAGALVSTVIDLGKWDTALYTEQLLPRARLEEMWAPTDLNSGQTADYGFGWSLGRYRGHRCVAHGGGFLGFLSYISRFVDDRLTVVVLTNLDGGDPGRMASEVASYYLPAPKPVDAQDPATARRLRSLLLSLTAGRLEPAQCAPEAPAASRLEETAAFYRALGPLKSLRLLDQTRSEDRQTYHFRAVFHNTRWLQTLVLTDTGQIHELTIEPG